MPRTNPAYPPEFRREAIRTVRASDEEHPIPGIAREIGVDIQRVCGSLKLGWVTSSLLVSRFEAKPRKSSLERAIQEYGRLQKTLFLLRYAESEDLRKRITRQLNKARTCTP